MASQLNIPSDTNGVVVGQVSSGSPAAKAGLQRMDVITAINGKALTTESGLAETLSTHKAGDTVTLTVLRGTQKVEVKVTLGTRPANLG